MLDGALCLDTRARRAALGPRARPWIGKLRLGSHVSEGGARRGGRSRGLGVVGRGELIDARVAQGSAPRARAKQQN